MGTGRRKYKSRPKRKFSLGKYIPNKETKEVSKEDMDELTTLWESMKKKNQENNKID